MYKLVLTLSIAIQLSLFFIVVSIALWLDALCNGVIGRLSTQPDLFKGVIVAVIVVSRLASIATYVVSLAVSSSWFLG